MNTLKQTLLHKTIKPAVGISIVLFFALSGASVIQAAWNNPTQSPPNGNVNPPINDSSTGQVKTGGLSLGSLLVNGGASFDSTFTVRRGVQLANQPNAQNTTFIGDPVGGGSDSVAPFAFFGSSLWNRAYLGIDAPNGDFFIYPYSVGTGDFDSMNILFDPSGTGQLTIDGYNAAGDGARVAINTPTVTSGLTLDVEGNVGAALYCDENATSCFDAANVVTSTTTPTGSIGFWNEAGGNVYRSTGNVGIGTAAPTERKLVINAPNDPDAGVLISGYTAGEDLNIFLDNTTPSVTGTAYSKLRFLENGATGAEVAYSLAGNRLAFEVGGLANTSSDGLSELNVLDGGVTINTQSISSDLSLDVQGKVGATEYCDENGLNCSLATDIGSNFWTENGDDVYRASGGVAIGLTSTNRSLETAGDIQVGGPRVYLRNNQFLDSASSSYLRFQSGGSDVSAIRLYDLEGDEYGRVYGAQGDNIGFLDGDGAWAIRHIKDSGNQLRINNVLLLDQRPTYALFNQGLYVYTDQTDTDFFVRDTDKGSVSNAIWYDYSAGRVYLGNTGGSGSNSEVEVRGDLDVNESINAVGDIQSNGTLVGGGGGISGSTIVEGLYEPARINVPNTLGALRGSAATTLGYAVRPNSGSAGGYVSSANNVAWQRGALELTGDLIFRGNSSAQSVAVGSPISLPVRFRAGSYGIGASAFCDINGANCISQSALSSGLWTASGSDIYRNTGGNVAIGTSSAGNARLYVSQSVSGRPAIYGYNTSASNSIGVRGYSATSVGGYFQSGGANYGTYTESVDSYALYGVSTNSGGIYGRGNAWGVYGQSDGANYGVYGRTLSASHGGVIGYSGNNSIYGILGHTNQYSLYGNGSVYTTGQIRTGSSLRADNGHIYLGAAGAQDLYGDDGTYLYYDSNNATTATIQLRRSDNTRLGSLYGYKSGTGAARIGLLDGDNQAAFLHYTDTYSRFYVNNLEVARFNANGSSVFYGRNGTGAAGVYAQNVTGNAFFSARSDSTANTDAYTLFHTSTDGTDNLYWAIGTDGSDGHRLKIRPGSSSDGSVSTGLAIERTGAVGIGTSYPSAGLKLDVEGRVGATEYCDQNGANCTLASAIGGDNLGDHLATADIRAIDGSAASPSLTFNSDQNTGIYRAGENIMSFSAGGVERARVDTSGLNLRNNFVRQTRGVYLGWNTTYGVQFNHGLFSHDGSAYSDDILLNSYGNVRINLDSNNNDTAETFEIGNHTTNGTSNTFLTVTATGDVGIGDATPDGALKVDISGDIGASRYCDTAGNNCTSAADIVTAAAGDDLGSHVATASIDMNGNTIVDTGQGVIRDGNGGWIRTYGDTGWYSQTHGGGVYMSDTTWIRTYANKNIYSGTGAIRADGGFQVDAKNVISNNGSIVTANQSVAGRYGYFEARDSGGGRGFYLGWGNGGSQVDLRLEDASRLYISGGAVGIGDATPDGGLELDVAGQIGADSYCDSSGANCFIATDVGSGGDNLGNHIATERLFLPSGNDTTNTGSSGHLVIGNTSATSISIDNNEILARNAGGASKLYIQHQGGAGNTVINANGGGLSVGADSLGSGFKMDVSGTLGADYIAVLPQNGSGEGGEIQLRGSGGGGNFQIDNLLGNARIHTLAANKLFIVEGGSTTGVQAQQFLYSSDRRLKTNFSSIGNEDDILSLGTYRFDWKEDSNADIGVIAQEVEKVFPEFVQDDADGFKTVDYAQLVVPLLEVVKKQDQEIKELQKAVNLLQAK